MPPPTHTKPHETCLDAQRPLPSPARARAPAGITIATLGALVLVQLIRHGGKDSPSFIIGYYISGAMGKVRARKTFTHKACARTQGTLAARLGRTNVPHTPPATPPRPAPTPTPGPQGFLAIGGILGSIGSFFSGSTTVSNLTVAEIQEVAALVQRLNAEGQTFLVIEHNLKVVRQFSHRVIVLDRGAMLAQGPAEQVLGDPRVIEASVGKGRRT